MFLGPWCFLDLCVSATDTREESKVMVASCPHMLPEPSATDIALADAGDVSAKNRVRVQQCKQRKRNAEIALWEEQNGPAQWRTARARTPNVSDDDDALDPHMSSESDTDLNDLNDLNDLHLGDDLHDDARYV